MKEIYNNGNFIVTQDGDNFVCEITEAGVTHKEKSFEKAKTNIHVFEYGPTWGNEHDRWDSAFPGRLYIIPTTGEILVLELPCGDSHGFSINKKDGVPVSMVVHTDPATKLVHL